MSLEKFREKPLSGERWEPIRAFLWQPLNDWPGIQGVKAQYVELILVVFLKCHFQQSCGAFLGQYGCLSEQWLKVYCKDLNGSEMRPVDDLGLVVCSCWQMKKCDLDGISNQSRLKSVRSVCVSVTNIRVLVKRIMASVLICVSCNGSFPKQDCLIAFNHLWSY